MSIWTKKVVIECVGVAKTAILAYGGYMAAGRVEAGLKDGFKSLSDGLEKGLRAMMSEKGAGADHIYSGLNALSTALSDR